MSFISYAQNFEDVRLWRAFSDVGAGRYLDIGTQDPVQDSVSLAFYERGWRGVHVEPTPAYAAAIRAARPDEVVIEAAVSMSPGPLRFFEIPETGLSTGDPGIAERHKASGWPCREIVVPTVTLDGIFDLMGADLIHWMKIDVEGMESDVLASWREHPARPAALVIEATAPCTQLPTHQAWHDLVTQRGYVEVLFDGLSRYFVHEDHAARGEALSLSPNVFDGCQIHQGHFAAHHLTQKHEAEVGAACQKIGEQRDRKIAEISGQLHDVQAQHEIVVAGFVKDSGAALAEAERLRNILEQQTKAHSLALTETRGAARTVAEQLGATQQEVALLRSQVLEEAGAHNETRQRAQAAAVEATAALETARAELVALKDSSAELARSQAIALCRAEDAAAANERDHAEAADRLNALQQGHLSLVRENGRLEGRIAAQGQAHAARLADAVTVRRQMASRLDRAEQLLSRAQAEATKLRSELSLQARDNGIALAAAERRFTLEAEAHARANADCDRLRLVIAEIQHQLAEQADINSAGAVHLGQLQAERDNLRDEIAAVRQQRVTEALAFDDRLAQLQHHIEWRERQLHAATALLEKIPHPMAGLPRILAALVRPWMSNAELAAIAKHRTGIDNFRDDLLLPSVSEVSHGAPTSSGRQTYVALATKEHGGVQNMEGDGPITSVPRLLAPHDREFIWVAYQAVLGRAPDPEGEAYYLTRLRAGTHKLAILKQLRRSPEGRNFIPGVAGLDRAIRRYHRANLPLIGFLVRMVTRHEGENATYRQLRIISNEIGRNRSDIGAVAKSLDNLRVHFAALQADYANLVANADQTRAAVLHAHSSDETEAQISLFDEPSPQQDECTGSSLIADLVKTYLARQ